MLLGKIFIHITFVYIAYTVYARDIFTKDFTIEKIQYWNESAITPLQMKLYIKRIDRSPHLFLDFNLTDHPKKYDMEIKIYYSSLGNRQYLSIPYAVRRTPWCEVCNTAYKQRVMSYVANISNFPFTNDRKVDICDIFPLGSYYLRGVKSEVNGKPYLIPDGLYKTEITIYKKNKPEIDFGLKIITRIFR